MLTGFLLSAAVHLITPSDFRGHLSLRLSLLANSFALGRRQVEDSRLRAEGSEALGQRRERNKGQELDPAAYSSVHSATIAAS